MWLRFIIVFFYLDRQQVSNFWLSSLPLCCTLPPERMTMTATPDFDFALGEAAEMIRESTRRFAAERIAPLAARIDAEDWFARE
ncbi:acyl-CoA dehydrogenase family protein, partial [Acinetobacter baumannii]